MLFLPAGPINAEMLLRFGKRINLIPVYEATIVHQISDGGAARGLLEERQMGKGGTDRTTADWVECHYRLVGQVQRTLYLTLAHL